MIGALGAVVYCNRQIHRRNVSLVRSVQEGIACKDELLQKEEECRAYKAKIEAMGKRLEEKAEVSEESEAEDRLKWVLHEIAVRQLYLQPGITAKSLHEELHVPASLFGEHFKEQTGRNFSEHINKLRMDYAARQLTEYPNYTIDAIAKRCGVDSRQHFHRLFSEYFGITPSAFRKSHIVTDNK